MNFPGIVYNDLNGNTTYLPLEQVRVKASIVDVSARVTITQIYENRTNVETNRCKYRFPVPANAAICGFAMHTSDGRTITGISRAKDQATQEFEEAVKAGKFAGKLDYVTDDIFTISVGCISPQTTVEVRVVYVMTLSNDDNIDETRFQIPMAIGARYGIPSSELASTQAPDTSTRVKVMVHIQTNGRIQAIISPSHPDNILVTKHPTDSGRPSRRRSIVKFLPQSFLDRDFVLIIRAEDLDSPRCFAEVYRDHDHKEPDTIAMQLTIVPKFKLPPVQSQEYIFVVDRSSSMFGKRIDMAKRTLNTLLRMLPVQGTFFNIFSFGRDTNAGLWRQGRSKTYNQESLNFATKCVDDMDANCGPGTNILDAVERVTSSRITSIPTAIFILTDGEAYDIDESCEVVQAAVENSPAESPLRVFTLGIGDTVSSAMCEGIARAGNGVCLFAVEAEHILGKCARLFRAGKTPFIKNVTIDWGIPAEDLVNLVEDLILHPTIQQVPKHIQDIHAGHRINISAILSLGKSKIPTLVTLRGELDGGEAFKMKIPVQFPDNESRLSWVHTLVAWRLIQEYRIDGTFNDSEDTRKAIIVRLGEKYQLSSRYTSFVAIDEGQDDSGSDPRPMMTNFVSRSRGSNLRPGRENNRDSTGGVLHNLYNGVRSAVRNHVSGLFGFRLNNQSTSRNDIPGTRTPSHPDSDNGDDDSDNLSVRTFSTLSSLESSESSDNWSDWSSPASSPDQLEGMRSQSPQFMSAHLAPEGVQTFRHPPTLHLASPLPPPIAPEVVDLVKLQSWDGSFTLERIRDIIGNKAVDEANSSDIPDEAWATALFIVFVRKRMGSQKELVSDLTTKAFEFLQASGLKVQDVIRKAEAELA